MNLTPAPSLSFPSSPAPPPSVHSSPSNPSFDTASSASAHDSNPYSVSAFNGPYMGVVLVVLLITFFLMAAFSVYMRRYAFALDNEAGALPDHRRGRGLDRATINGFPIVVYHREKGGEATVPQPEHEWSHRPDCVVCLTDFQEAEKLRLLPRCEHWFHPECIDMWLFSHSTCPLCRRSLLPPPVPPPPLLLPVAEEAAAEHNEVCISIQAAPRPEGVAPQYGTSAPSRALS